MISNLTPLTRCQRIAGLAAHEIVLGVTPGKKHERLLARYRRGRGRKSAARVAIVADIRAALQAGARAEAADLLIVLRRLLTLDLDGAGQDRACARRKRLAAGRNPARQPFDDVMGEDDDFTPGGQVLPFSVETKK